VPPHRRSTPAPPDRQSFVDRLERSLDRLSPAQRQVGEYVLRNYREVAFMSVAELAAAAGVSPAGVVRFATSVEFAGYPELQRALHAIILSELRQGDRFVAALDGGSGEAVAERILRREVGNLGALRANLDRGALRAAVKRISEAPGVVIVGFRAAATLAQYGWYNLRKVKENVRLYTAPGSVTIDDLAAADRRTVVVLLTFRRYSRELVDVAEFVRTAGFLSVGITNNELSPLATLCEVCLFAEVEELSFTDYYAAPIALVNALVAEVAQGLGRQALERLNRLDDLAAERGYLFPSGRKRRLSMLRSRELWPRT
jgi:DNA-binding MurR/RpiR family transcriptional regulator